MFFHDSEGHKKEVSVNKFCDFLKNFDDHVETIFLNACFSLSGIEAISNPSFHLIGMKEEVPNDTALSFARAFYTSHCNGKSVKDAFETAKGVVGMDGFNDELIPKHIQSTKPDKGFEPPEKVEEKPVEEVQEQNNKVSLVSKENIALVKKNRIKDKRFYYIIIAVLVATSAALVVSSLSLEDKSILFTSIGSLPLFTLKWPFDKLESIKKALESIIILENEVLLSHQMSDDEKRTLNNQFRRIVEAKI